METMDIVPTNWVTANGTLVLRWRADLNDFDEKADRHVS